MATKRLKYGNRPTGGYASRKEARRAQELRLLERAGKICYLRERVRYLLIPAQKGERPCHYVADFAYIILDGSTATQIVEDVKGHRTKDYIIKRKLMQQVHGIRIKET